MSRPRRQSQSFDLASARSVLVVKPSSLGDIVHTLPAVERLHRARPDLAIDWVANTEWTPLLRDNPALRTVLSLPRRQWKGWRSLPAARSWARQHLAPLAPDLVLDFQGLLRSALLSRASKPGWVAGFRKAREGASWFYDQKVEIEPWDRTHAVDRYLSLASAVGVPDDSAGSVSFPLPDGDPVDLPGWESDRPFLLLHPFSRGRGKSMSFPEVAGLCQKISGASVVIVGAGMPWPDDLPWPENAVNGLDRTSLTQLIWLMRRARWIASVDSGPMHLAAGITGRLLSIHTWTDPLMVGPWRKDATVWRDGFLGPVGEIAPGQFPENRADRARFDQGILPGDAIDRVAAFLAEKMRGPA